MPWAPFLTVVGLVTLVCLAKREWLGTAFGIAVVVSVPYLLQHETTNPSVDAITGYVLLCAVLAVLFPLLGALRIAHPRSWWARRFYDEQKMAWAEYEQIRPMFGEPLHTFNTSARGAENHMRSRRGRPPRL